jgi:hypothetical protein
VSKGAVGKSLPNPSKIPYDVTAWRDTKYNGGLCRRFSAGGIK